jgi:hypothetical protein
LFKILRQIVKFFENELRKDQVQYFYHMVQRDILQNRRNQKKVARLLENFLNCFVKFMVRLKLFVKVLKNDGIISIVLCIDHVICNLVQKARNLTFLQTQIPVTMTNLLLLDPIREYFVIQTFYREINRLHLFNYNTKN